MDGFRYKHGDRPLEGYTIQRAVGRGGFGEVYFAVSDSGREIALKVIQGYEQIELRGVSACMNLKSPHLVTIFDVRHNADGVPFVLMEYVAGPSLRELLDGSPAGLGQQKAAFFLREIAKGITYLHDRGIVHRDLKPGNIFYEDGYVKIGDYGLSKAMAASRHSGQTITVGTVHYMAPEIGQGRYDASIDVYALGCVLYEMLTGQTPFLGGSPGEILMKHLMAEPDLTGIEEPFATVIRKAMAKEPADRYHSAQELVEAVFGTEHIRNSVSHFSPESLTMVADRVARTVTIGGGSSADANRLGGGEPATERLPDEPWDRFSRRMQDVGRRLEGVGEGVSQRMQQVGDRFAGRAASLGTARPQIAQPAPAVEPVDDPITWNQRRLLAVMTAFFVAAGTGALIGHSPFPQGLFWALLSFVVITGGAGGIVAARKLFGPALENERLLGRLAYGMVGGTYTILCLSIALSPYAAVQAAGSDRGLREGLPWFLLFFIPFLCFGAMTFQGLVRKGMRGVRGEAGRAIYVIPLVAAATGLGGVASGMHGNYMAGKSEPDVLFTTLLTCGIIMLVLNWGRLTAPDRRVRVSLRSAVLAGASAYLLSLPCEGQSVVAAGVLAGMVLVAQIVSPFGRLATATHAAAGSPAGQAAAMTGQASATTAPFPGRAQRTATAVAPAHRPVDGLDPLTQQYNCSDRLRGGALMLACVGFVFPLAGLQRFYVGKIGTGILWLCTFGFFHVGTIIDIICIVTGSFRDKEGRRLLVWWDTNELAGRVPPSPMPRVIAPANVTPSLARPSRSFVDASLAFFGGVLMLAALVIGLAAAVNLPSIVALGWPDRHLAADLHRLFGYAGWPQLVLKAFWASFAILTVLSTLLMLIARRQRGGAHVARAVLGAIAIFAAMQLLGQALMYENWPLILDTFDQHRAGPAIEIFLDAVRTNQATAAGALLLVFLLLFAWPARKRPAETSSGGQGVSS